MELPTVSVFAVSLSTLGCSVAYVSPPTAIFTRSLVIDAPMEYIINYQKRLIHVWTLTRQTPAAPFAKRGRDPALDCNFEASELYTHLDAHIIRNTE